MVYYQCVNSLSIPRWVQYSPICHVNLHVFSDVLEIYWMSLSGECWTICHKICPRSIWRQSHLGSKELSPSRCISLDCFNWVIPLTCFRWHWARTLSRFKSSHCYKRLWWRFEQVFFHRLGIACVFLFFHNTQFPHRVKLNFECSKMYIIQKNIMPYFIRDQYPTHSYSERYHISLPYQRKLARLLLEEIHIDRRQIAAPHGVLHSSRYFID